MDTFGASSAQVGDSSDHAQDAVAPEPDRKRSELHAETGARVDETECQCRTKKESCVALVSGRWFPFLLLPRTPLILLAVSSLR